MIKKPIIAVIVLLILLISSCFFFDGTDKKYEFIVELKKNTDKNYIQNFAEKFNGKLKKLYPKDSSALVIDTFLNAELDNQYILTLNSKIDVKKLKEFYEIIKDTSSINFIEYNSRFILDSLTLQNDPIKEQDEYNLNLIGKNKIPDSINGSGVTVAVIDYGVDTSHNDLQENIQFNNLNKRAFNAIEGQYDNDDFPPNSHATHVAGIVAAQKNNKGVTGVAPSAKMLPIKAFSFKKKGSDHYVGSCTSIDICKAIAFAINDKNRPKVINLSADLSMPEDNFINKYWNSSEKRALKTILKEAYEKNIFVVFSAGNHGMSSETFFPANSKYVFCIGNCDGTMTRHNTSNYGVNIAIYAPGVLIKSLAMNQNTIYNTGTSMAAPHVAGAIALFLQVKPYLKPDDLRKMFNDTTLSKPVKGDRTILVALPQGDLKSVVKENEFEKMDYTPYLLEGEIFKNKIPRKGVLDLEACINYLKNKP